MGTLDLIGAITAAVLGGIGVFYFVSRDLRSDNTTNDRED